MKNIISTTLRIAALAATLVLLPSAFAQSSDRAAQQLTATGSVRISSAGPYVSQGTYRIQVTSKLGHPTSTLPDGTWLYDGFNAQSSSATGTLVVKFEAGRVSSLSLASPTVIAAMRSQPVNLGGKSLVAAWNQQ